MKYLFFSVFCFLTFSAMAQDGPPPKMDSATMHTMMLKRYKSSNLGLSDQQIEEVVDINQSMMKDGRPDKNTENGDRKTTMQAMEKIKLDRLTKVLGDEKLAKKVMDFDKKNRRSSRPRHEDQDMSSPSISED